MLVLTQYPGNSIQVGGVLVTVLEVLGEQVRLGFEGDRSIPILRTNAKQILPLKDSRITEAYGCHCCGNSRCEDKQCVHPQPRPCVLGMYRRIEGNMSMELSNAEWVIENEIKQGLKQSDIAMTYAMALCIRHYKVDFARINRAILAKWPRGLERVKVKAWKIVEQKTKEARAEAAKRN